jgi:hypothetical protein
LTLLADHGVPAGCQGDIDAVLTMALYHRAAGVVSFMGCGFRHGNQLVVVHCVLPRKMKGPGAFQPYSGGARYESQHGRLRYNVLYRGPQRNPHEQSPVSTFFFNILDRCSVERCRDPVIDVDGDGQIDEWIEWHRVKESYDQKPGFARIVDLTPAAVDLSSLPAGRGIQFEFKTR